MNKNQNWKAKYESTNAKEGIEIVKKTPKGLMYISSPKEIIEEIKKIPKGSTITTKDLAEKLSNKHNTDYTCGLTTGIFMAIIANYVEEEDIKDIPYWRVTKSKGELYDTYLRETSRQKEHLISDGIDILQNKKGQFFVLINDKKHFY